MTKNLKSRTLFKRTLLKKNMFLPFTSIISLSLRFTLWPNESPSLKKIHEWNIHPGQCKKARGQTMTALKECWKEPYEICSKWWRQMQCTYMQVISMKKVTCTFNISIQDSKSFIVISLLPSVGEMWPVWILSARNYWKMSSSWFWIKILL